MLNIKYWIKGHNNSSVVDVGNRPQNYLEMHEWTRICVRFTASVVRVGIRKSPSQRYGSLVFARTVVVAATGRRGRNGEKKVANQLLADGATTPGRGCNVPGLLISQWKLCPDLTLPPMRERETISRARETWLRWLFSDSVGFRAHDLMYACTDSGCCGKHNNAVFRVEKLSRDHDRDEEAKGGGRREDADDDENEDDGIRGAA